MTPQSDVPLAAWCTLGIGGPARWFVAAASEEAIRSALAWAHARDVAVYVLGGGSNVVVADDGFDGLVIKVDIRGVSRSESNGRVHFVVGAGEAWDPFVAITVAEDCAGLECLSGIPGLVGGTPIQNVGAYGQEVSATITRVHLIDRRTREIGILPSEECGFEYRTSRFKHKDDFIVTGVEYGLLAHGAPTVAYADVISYFENERETPSLTAVRDAVLRIRRRKGMVIEEGNPAIRSVGSFFVNPIVTRAHFDRIAACTGDPSRIPHYPAGGDAVKVPAAWLIEQAGFPKGSTRGAIGVSPFQAQAIVNHGGARAADVIALASDIKRAVWERFGVAIVPEPVFVGFRPSDELRWLLDPRPHIESRKD
jgi:UDP-N-acetylmuramate dehydrogenase